MNELTQAHIEKKNNRKLIYENLYKQCCEKVRYMNEQWHKTSCNFIVPSIQMGMPIYKMETCIVFIMYQLKQKGFFVQFVYPNILNISWKHALIRALKQDDKEWYKITEGKLYDTKISDPGEQIGQQQLVDNVRWDYALLQGQQDVSGGISGGISGSISGGGSVGVLNNEMTASSSLYSRERANERAQEIAQAQLIQHDYMEQAKMRGIVGVNQPQEEIQLFRDTITVEAGGEEETKAREHDRKKRIRKANEQRYKTEQQRIADVISKKNSQAMRALTYSSSDTLSDKGGGHKNKKVLKIQTQ